MGVDTTLSSYTVLTQMVRSGEKLLNDLIIFLTVCPQGLCLSEVEIVLKKFPSSLSTVARAKQIKLYIDLFRESAKIKNSSELQLETATSDISSENLERQENLREMIQSLLFFESVEDMGECDEIRVKLSDNERPALEFIVRSNSQISQSIANISSTQLLKYALDFYLPYSKFLLFKIRDIRSTSYGDHKFVSASMMFGIWRMMSKNHDFE